MVEEQKPYWPGLEIDGQQEGKLRSDGKSVTEETNTAAISVEEEQKLPPTDDSKNVNKKRCLGGNIKSGIVSFVPCEKTLKWEDKEYT